MRTLRALLFVTVLFVLVTAVQAIAPTHDRALAAGSGATVTGSWHRWNPVAHDNGDGTFTGAYDTKVTPSVTVSQTQNLVDQVVHVSWKGFTPSSNNVVYYDENGSAGTGVTTDNLTTLYEVEVLECRGTAPTINPRTTVPKQECYSAEITPGAVAGQYGQNNAVRAVTQLDGSGSVDFHVENEVTNDLLGCDATHPCSIVVLPNNGGMQSASTFDDTSGCNDHSSDFLSPPDYLQADYFADQNFVGSACSWADRIAVPLHFAPIPLNCPSSALSFNAIGSPMLERGLNQQIAGWCRGKDPVNFGYNSTSDEYDARTQFLSSGNGLTASADAALVSQPADPSLAGSKKFTYAPIANNAISIPYYVDNAKTGLPMTDLRLDARLVAKLLTQSYQPFHYNCQGVDDPNAQGPGCAPTVAGNPASIFDDPEFQKLNFNRNHPDRSYFPSDAETGNQDALGGFFPTVVAGQSDLSWALTSWIESDKDAAAFLAGQAAPGGMHVNSSYKLKSGTLYPSTELQPLEPGWTAPVGSKERFQEGFQGSWNPLSGLSNISTTLVANQSTALDTTTGHCADGTNSCVENTREPVNFTKVGAEPLGARDLWAITDNADTQAFDFPAAQLVNAAGTAVGPTSDAMSAALAKMHTNPDKITQYVDYRDQAATGYPLTVVDYAMVPTCGLNKTKLAGIRSFLTHVTESQTVGVQPGDLAPGLLPLTAKQLAATRAAAKAVSAQTCTAPPADTTIGGRRHTHTGSNRHSGGGTGSTGGSSGGGSGTGGTSSNSTGKTGKANATGTSTPSTQPGTIHAANAGYKPSGQGGSLSLALPIMLIIGAGLLAGGPLTWWLGATESGRAALARLKAWR